MAVSEHPYPARALPAVANYASQSHVVGALLCPGHRERLTVVKKDVSRAIQLASQCKSRCFNPGLSAVKPGLLIARSFNCLRNCPRGGECCSFVPDQQTGPGLVSGALSTMWQHFHLRDKNREIPLGVRRPDSCQGSAPAVSFGPLICTEGRPGRLERPLPRAHRSRRT